MRFINFSYVLVLQNREQDFLFSISSPCWKVKPELVRNFKVVNVTSVRLPRVTSSVTSITHIESCGNTENESYRGKLSNGTCSVHNACEFSSGNTSHYTLHVLRRISSTGKLLCTAKLRSNNAFKMHRRDKRISLILKVVPSDRPPIASWCYISSGGSEGGLGGPWPPSFFVAPLLVPPVLWLIPRSSSFDWHIQQITFSQQNFERFEELLATLRTIFTSFC